MVSVIEKQLIPAGYKQTEVGVIPEDWSVETLANICEKITDGTHATPKPTALGVPFLTAIHVKENRIDFDACYYLPKLIHDEIYRRCNPQRNDVLLVNIGAGVATSALVKVDYEFSLKNVALLKPSKQKIIGAYLNFYQSAVKNKVAESLATGGAQPFLSLFQIGQLKISLPSVQEQTAIANALSDVDALIAGLEKLFNKKSAIKTAAMQQLLTGKKRLPPFDQTNTGYKQTDLGEIPVDWAVSAVHGLLKETPKYGINAAAVPLTANLPVYIRITDISEDGYFQPSEKVGVNNQFSDFYKLKKGDIVLARTGASVGKSYLYREADGELIYAGFLIKLSPKEAILDSMFLFQYFRAEPYWAWVNVMSMRSGQPGINGNEFGSLQIPLPCIDEQTAIANVLSDMDKDLAALQQRLHKTQQIKQGMMQELLTGKTRLV